ncbi:hypothetical protein SAMN03097699_3377 [Flavobacteriaceae bacterium MAR_2010_188]|nr:hypothetical protein SAMN03097699_3377 [Flavobacteriaceae bacterium MAR_2010_188]
MKGLRITSLIFFILSQLSLTLIPFFNDQSAEFDFPYILIIWGIGLVNVTLNFYYAIKLKLRSWIFILLLISSFAWFFLPFFYTYFGIPFYALYFIIVLYMHWAFNRRGGA